MCVWLPCMSSTIAKRPKAKNESPGVETGHGQLLIICQQLLDVLQDSDFSAQFLQQIRRQYVIFSHMWISE